MKSKLIPFIAGFATIWTCGLPATQAAETKKIAVVIKGLDNPFFQYMRQGIADEARTLGVSVTIEAATNMGDSTGQADRLSALANQKYDCYLVNPISVSNLVQALVPVARKKAPIVNIDSPIDPTQASAAGFAVSTYIGTDNVYAGQLAGEEMARLLPAGSEVAPVTGIVGDVSNNARIKGFKQGIAGKLKVVEMVSADWDREKALTATDAILRAHPNLKGIFSANDTMALGVARSVLASGKDIKVIGLDGITDALKEVQAGQLTGTVSQYPYVVGKMGLEACAAAAEGKTLPAKVGAPVRLITQANAGAALKNFPQPAAAYPDPFTALLGTKP